MSALNSQAVLPIFASPGVSRARCVISVLERLKQKFKLASMLVTREELKSVLSMSAVDPPDGSLYKIGDIIHTSAYDSARNLRVYGIKAGGYGFAYIVLDEETLTPFCLKTFRDNSPEQVEEFKREAETWIKVGKHPNLIYVDCVLIIGGRPYILFEYASGSDLRRQIKQGPIPIKPALKYAIQFCRGMTYARSKLPGFVHGDIKPNNCLITQDQTLKIADFGQVDFDESSELYESEHDLRRASPGFNTPIIKWRAGTPAYMAPEQFDSANKVDARSDVYCFGVMLFEMLTGVRPFSGRKHKECFLQHMTVAPADPSSLNAQIPRSLSQLILSCLAKSPVERPSDFRLLENELGSMLWNLYQEKVTQVETEELTDGELVSRGASLLVLDRHNEALQSFDRLLLLKPQLARVWEYKGEAHAGLGHYEEALDCLNRAIELDSQVALTWANKGKTLIRLGQHESALACFDQALTLDPQMACVWTSRAQTLLNLGRLEASLKDLRRALAVDPQHLEALNNLGVVLDTLGSHDEAIDAHKKAIHQNPRYVEAHCNLGDLYRRLGRLSDAINSYQQAISVKPGHPQACSGLSIAGRDFYSSSRQFLGSLADLLIAFSLSEHDDPDDVVATASNYLRLSDCDPRVFYLSAHKLCAALERTSPKQKEVLAALLAAVRDNIYAHDQERNAFYWLGRIYYALDLLDECAKVFQQSITLFGPDDKALYFVGACNEIGGEHRTALDSYRKALLLDPGCPLIAAGIKRTEAHETLSRARRCPQLRKFFRVSRKSNLCFARGNA